MQGLFHCSPLKNNVTWPNSLSSGEHEHERSTFKFRFRIERYVEHSVSRWCLK